MGVAGAVAMVVGGFASLTMLTKKDEEAAE